MENILNMTVRSKRIEPRWKNLSVSFKAKHSSILFPGIPFLIIYPRKKYITMEKKNFLKEGSYQLYWQ